MDDRVRLTLNSIHDAEAPARAAASGLAFRLGLSATRVESLRLAVSEAVKLAATFCTGALQVTYVLVDGHLSVELASRSDEDRGVPTPANLMSFSAAMAALEADHSVDDGTIRLSV